MENSSTSRLSPVWPTRWPKSAFRPAPTAFVLIGAIAIGLVMLLVSAGAVGFWFQMHGIHLQHGAALPPAWLVEVALLLQLVIEIPIVIFLLIALPPVSGFTLRDLGFHALSGRVIWIGLLGALAMIVVANGAAALIDYATHAQHDQDVVKLFKALHDPRAIAFFAIFAISAAPIAEEIVFRVFLFNVGVRYGGFWIGALASGILFGLAHGDKYALVPLALGGIVLCAVYYYSRNAFASMISHGIFNAFSVVGLLVSRAYPHPHP